jgi:hypothetical protein
MSNLPNSVGDQKAQSRFIVTHEAFLREFPELQRALDTMLTESQRKISEERATAKDAPRTDEELASAIAFSLERAAYDDFAELLVLAGNGLGLGATKVLRSLYERLVTAMYIAQKPSEARQFVDQSAIERGKIINRYKEVVPDRLAKDFTTQELAEIQKRFTEAKERRKEEFCEECNQPKTQEAWTRVGLDAMARKVSKQLFDAYATCYLNPTYLTHATPTGLDFRVRSSEEGFEYKHLSEPEAHGAVMRGHFLMLGVLSHLNEHFKIGRDDEVKKRFDAFDPIWAKDDEN